MRAGLEDVLEVADYAAHLPRGSAMGEWVGGVMAVTPDVEALWEISYILAQVNSKKKVKPRTLPEGVREREQREARKRQHALRMADKYRGRYG